MNHKFFLLLFIVLLLASCTQKKTEYKIAEEIPATEEIVEVPKTVFDVLEKSDLFSKPSDGEKVLNQKATNALGETTYCSIDPSTTVKIIDEQGDWVKIQVVSPDWLSDSHIGWVKAAIIDRGKNSIEAVEGKDYTIMLEDKKGNMTNYYIKNISCPLNNKDLLLFAKTIKADKQEQCNIYIFEDDSVKDLMTKYPLRGTEYIKVADKFAFELSFDGSSSFYPFQDIQYKEFGGSNWKKTPIE